MADVGLPSAFLTAPAVKPRPIGTGALMVTIGIVACLAGSLVIAGWISDQPVPVRYTAGEATLISSTTAVAPAAHLGLNAADTAAGVAVTGTDPDTPAEASLRAGDLILALNGHPISTVADLRSLVLQHAPGTLVTVELRRNHVTLQLQVQLTNER